MKYFFYCFVLLFAISFTGCKKSGGKVTVKETPPPFLFYSEVMRFKDQDEKNFPDSGGILFIGSSTIRYWSDLESAFPGKSIIRRGLGGSLLSDWVKYYLPYVVFPYHPAKIFIYAGDNDVVDGRTAGDVVADFEKLWTLIHTQLPETKIYFISIKPSPSRMGYWAQYNSANLVIKESIGRKPLSYFIDITWVTFDPKTMQPDPTLFQDDAVHLNTKGYMKWETVIKNYIDN